jgi:hypothetical protein
MGSSNGITLTPNFTKMSQVIYTLMSKTETGKNLMHTQLTNRVPGKKTTLAQYSHFELEFYLLFISCYHNASFSTIIQ